MNRPQILVVEDDPAVRNLITTTLETQDYQFHTAQNGGQAIMEAVSGNPDVILLDLGLPDMDGTEIIKKVRSWSQIPIIVISARGEAKDKIEALDLGASDYLTKPFLVEELLARLRVALRRLQYQNAEQKPEETEFINGDLKIDYVSGCVRLKRKGSPSDFHRIPAACTVGEEYRKSTDPDIYHERNMGQRMGK